MIQHNIDIYLRHTEMENMYVRELIELVTNDHNGNVFNFTIYEADNTVYDLTGKAVKLIVKSEKGTVIQENCTISDATTGKAKITLPSDMFCEGGTYYAEVQIWKGTSRITSLPFDYTARLSLETDVAVKADNRFSLLQQALEDVSNADTTSKEALKIANQAKGTVDVLVPRANQAAQNAQEALNRAESVVTQEELAKKITIDAKAANFNFNGRKVEQEGLVYVAREAFVDVTTNHDASLDFQFLCQLNLAKWNNSEPLYLLSSSGANPLSLYLNQSTKLLSFSYISEGTRKYVRILNSLDLEGSVCLYFSKVGNTIIATTLTNGHVETTNNLLVSPLVSGTVIIRPSNGVKKNELLYNRQLTPQEIQHDFQVLNNSESIDSISITDKDGASKNFILGTDSYHTTMANGYNLEQFATSIMKRDAQTFTSVDGSPIEINNGMEYSKVLSGEIQGQTVKNYAKNAVKNFILNGYDYNIIAEMTSLEVGKTYRVGIAVKSTSTNVTVKLGGVEKFIDKSFTDGMNYVSAYVDITISSITDLNLYVKRSNALTQITDVWVTDLLTQTSYIPFGLSSTQAIIKNNGNSYEIYESTIQGKTRILKALKGTQNWVEISADEIRDTVIYDYKLDSIGGDLGSVPSVVDYVDRARKVKIANTREVVPSDTDDIIIDINKTNTISFLIRTYKDALGATGSNTAKCLCNEFATKMGSDLSADIEGFAINMGLLCHMNY